MGRSKPGKVALLAVLIAMLVGFGRLQPRPRPPEVTARPEPLAEQPVNPRPAAGPGSESDPVSQFLTDLVSVDASDPCSGSVEEAPAVALPLIGDLPPLPEAYWPIAPLFTQAFPSRSRVAAY